MSLFQVTKKQVIENYELRTMTGDIVSFAPSYSQLLPDPFSNLNVMVNVTATSGNGTPDNPIQNGTPWIDSNVINKEPYIKRAVAGTASRIGNHLYDKLVGGTVAFNQLLENGNFATVDGWSFNSGTGAVASNKLTFTITEAVASNSIYHSLVTKVIQGHKYFVSAVVTPSKNATFQSRVGNAVAPMVSVSANTRTNIINIIVGDDSETTMFMIYCNRGVLMAAGDTCVYEKVFCIDLTQMFGSTIADYIYGLEQATAGAGVAFFKALFPNDYYAYNAGELMSVKATAHIMRNASNTVIGNYALDSNLELRGIPKLVNNKLEYDGDTYESSGKVTRKYGVVVYDGSDDENWTMHESGSASAFAMRSNVVGLNINIDAIPKANYLEGISRNTTWSNYDNWVSVTSGSQIVTGIQSITTVEAWKTYLSTHPLAVVYELGTPTEETADTFTNPQVCDENGTEEYTDSRAVAIPVGHETYQANICPIEGYSSANITRCGVNLVNPDNLETGWLLTDGTVDRSMTKYKTTDFIKVTPSSTLGITITDSSRCKFYDTNKQPLTSSFDGNINGNVAETFTVTSGTYYVRKTTATANVATFAINTDGDTAYHAYNGQTYTIAFGQTVYGGVLDVTRGKLHVTHGYAPDMSAYNYTKELSGGKYHYYSGQLPNAKHFDFAELPDALCSKYPVITRQSLYAGNLGCAFDNTGCFYVYNANYDNESTTATDVKNDMSGVQVVYELATPFDIDLAPEVISAIVGTNNVFADCGETTVTCLI